MCMGNVCVLGGSGDGGVVSLCGVLAGLELGMWHRWASNSQTSTCFCLLRAGIKDVPDESLLLPSLSTLLLGSLRQSLPL